MASDREWLRTVKQVAERLGLREGTILTSLAEGRLPKICCGRAASFPAGEVQDFVRRNAVPAREGR